MRSELVGPDRETGFEAITGCSAEMRAAFEQARRAAQTDATVLIRGESGTGKELFAEAIHRSSPRRSGPFVAVNMAALPDTLIESELFGHTAGAFTGAAGPRIGRFEAAHKGSLFIDELGDLRLPSQAKLLRVLENHMVTPIGGNDAREVDVRVIAATNRNLERMVAEREFREDLYYRLNVVTLTLPPLKARREDIPLLVERFLDEVCAANGRPRPVPDGELWRFLETYDWPGNIRQLRNVIESMVVLADGPRLTMGDLPAMVHRRSCRSDGHLEIPSGFTLEEVERAAVLQALDGHKGNRTQAADALGISVRTLQRRLKKWRADTPAAGNGCVR